MSIIMGLKSGAQAALGKWSSMGPGSPLGAKFYENTSLLPQLNDRCWTVGWHGTYLHSVESQIYKGAFDKLGKHIFLVEIYQPEKAVHFVINPAKKCEPIILKIASQIEPAFHPLFNTLFFPGTAPGDVHIAEAYRICDKYQQYIADPKLRERFLQAFLAGQKAYEESMKGHKS